MEICFDKRQVVLGDINPRFLRRFITFGPFILENGHVIEVGEIIQSSIINLGQCTNPYLC